MSGILDQVLEGQKEIQRQLASMASDVRLSQEWYTASDCARLKGISAAALSQNRWMRPQGGKGTKRIGRRERWHRSAVQEWLVQDDEQLLALYGSASDRARYGKEGIGKQAKAS